MNENNVKTKKKKSKVLLIIIIIILILALIAGGIYLMSSNDKTPWKTGEVQILEQKIKLPMLITDFEKQFNVKLVKTDEEQMNTVTIDEDTDTPLNLTIFVFDDSITGLVVSTYKSNDEEQETAINEIASERSIAKRVVFPGNVTIDTPITEINKIYQSKPSFRKTLPRFQR